MVMRQDFLRVSTSLTTAYGGVYGDFPTCKPKWRRTTSASTVKGTHNQGARRERKRHSVLLSHVVMLLMNLTMHRMEEGDSRQVNSGMRYFAQSLEQHLEE